MGLGRKVSTTAPSNGVSFTNASAISLTLSNVAVFVGTGGSLSSATATANVVNGNLGFAGTVTTLKVVSIKDTNNGSAPARNITLSAQSPDKWKVVFDPKVLAEIPPKQTVNINVDITPADQSLAGEA